MKRERKELRFFELPKLDEVPKSLDSRGRTRFAFERVGNDLQISITYTVGAERPDLIILLNRGEVESVLAHLCAYLLDKEIKEIQTMAEDIAQAAETLEGK